MNGLFRSILRALARCRWHALSIFCVYILSITVGILMAQNGSRFALLQRDRIVSAALRADRASISYQGGHRFAAVVWDFAGNLFIAAISQTLMGLGVVPPYATAAYQGWVGGIVSVDAAHRSRFVTPKATVYYFAVLLLQTLAFSLSIGGGVRCGADTYRHNSDVGGRLWKWRIRKESLADLGLVLLGSIPLFLAGSCLEFLSSWNA